ncbi:hypothetical protein HPB48_016988 [Haemaphysalis longicornis]|uniref:Uncharacterized protein n=1 Tax=Haemaphysalis longicornis TaxID=44386 RepID=A0A9J6FY44_HAELO|nr:hypothetical protein HPB48_016988 [Haemaphysalis longicornis]
MGITSSKTPVLEEGELALYWDPRYKSYFYAGIMTPPTGQLYDLRGRPVTIPTDTHTWSVVRLASSGPHDTAPPPGPPILLRPNETGQRWRRNQGRQISWDFFLRVREAPSEFPSVKHDRTTLDVLDIEAPPEHQHREDKRERSLPTSLCYCLCPLVLLIMVIVAIVIAFSLMTAPSGGSTTSSYTGDSDSEIFTEVIYSGLVPASHPRLRRRGTAEPTMHHRGDRLIHTFSQHTFSVTTDFPVLASSVQIFDAAVPEARDTRSPGNLKTRRNVCVRVGWKSPFGCHEGNTPVNERYQKCDALIHCCYYLPIDLSLEDRITARGDWRADDLSMAEKREPRTSILLGVYVGDDAAFERLLFNRSGERTKFLSSISQIAPTGRFSGVRLWVPLQGRPISGFDDHLVGLARDAAAKLREINCSFGFFLPRGLLSKWRGVTTTVLSKALDSPYSLLVYPAFPVLENTTGSTSGTWPTSEEVLTDASVETEANRNRSSVCFLPPPPVAVYARLPEICDPSKTQLVSRSIYLSLPMLADVCRRLALDDSWMTSAREYDTFACKDSRALLYQTRRQARKFREELFRAAPSSTCLGSFVDLECLPGACSKIYSRDCVKGLTTGSGPTDWPHFERVRELIGAPPSNDPTLVQESECTVDELASSPTFIQVAPPPRYKIRRYHLFTAERPRAKRLAIDLSSADEESFYKLMATRFSTEITGRMTVSSRWRRGRHDSTM